MKRILPILILLGIAACALAVNPYMMVLARKNAGGGATDYTADPNIVAYWRMTSTGTETDIVSTNDLPEFGVVVATADVPTGYSGTSRGDTSGANFLFVSDANSVGLKLTGPLTIAGWIKIHSGLTENDMLFGKYTTSARQYAIWNNTSGQFVFRVSNDGTTATDATAPSSASTGVWYHVAGTYSSPNSILWIDGNPVTTNTVTGPLNSSAAAFTVFTDGGTSFLPDAYTDDVVVFSRALSQSELQDLANDGVDGAKGGND